MKRDDYWKGFWRLADPKLTAASVSSMGIGMAAATRVGPAHWGWFILTVAGIVCLEVAKNASGEITDFDSGTDLMVSKEDRSPFSGGRRVMVDGLLTREETREISALMYAAGVIAGLAIALFREPRVGWIGVIGTLLAWGYAGWPLKLAYRGWGETAVAISYGPLICCGTYLVQRRDLPWAIVWLSIPLGLLIAGFLWVNEFPDYVADCKAGKRNMVVKLGRFAASRWVAVILCSAFVLQWILPFLGLPGAVRWGILGIPLAWLAARRVMSEPDCSNRIVAAQAWTLQCFLALAVATAAGLLLVPGR